MACPSVIDFCTMRVTALDELGNVQSGTGNYYVTGSGISLQLTPDIETGEERILKGCRGCIIASNRQPDRLKRWQLEFTDGLFEAPLLALLTGNDEITDGANIVGLNGVSQLDCDFEPPLVAIEAWADATLGDSPDPDYPFVYFVWPATFWNLGQNQIGADYWQPVLAGFSRSNSLWGTGPFDDLGIDAFSVSEWAISQVVSAPESTDCALGTVAPGS